MAGDSGRQASTGTWRGLAAVAVGLAVVAALVMLTAETSRDAGADALAAEAALGPAGLARALGGSPDDFRRSISPVDLDTAEQAARVATAGQMPMPDGRHLATYLDRSTNAQVTEAVLVYGDPSGAAALDRVASPLLGSTFGLMSEPIDLPGAVDARLWRRSDYRAVTFRVGGLVGLVGTTRSSDDSAVLELANALRDSLAAAPTPTPVWTAAP